MLGLPALHIPTQDTHQPTWPSGPAELGHMCSHISFAMEDVPV